MIQRLFVYGTLAPGRPNEHLLGKLNGLWEDAAVTGILQNEGWGAAMGYPAIVLSEDGGEVSGLLFTSEELSDYWSILDEFEGQAYKRVITHAKIKGSRIVDAYIYALKLK